MSKITQLSSGSPRTQTEICDTKTQVPGSCLSESLSHPLLTEKTWVLVPDTSHSNLSMCCLMIGPGKVTPTSVESLDHIMRQILTDHKISQNKCNITSMLETFGASRTQINVQSPELSPGRDLQEVGAGVRKKFL